MKKASKMQVCICKYCSHAIKVSNRPSTVERGFHLAEHGKLVSPPAEAFYCFKMIEKMRRKKK
jgi:hypothetical protein